MLAKDDSSAGSGPDQPASAHSPASGTGSLEELSDRYQLLKPMPRGGSGASAYLAKKRGSESTGLCVVKHFDAASVSKFRIDREHRAVRLSTEADNCLGLVEESSRGDAGFWYSMPYFDGETLHEEVIRVMAGVSEMRDEGRLRLILHWMRQLIGQTIALHRVGIVHKDIKPSNLLVDGERIRLIDVGLVFAIGSTSPLTASGTEHYRDREIDSLYRQNLRIADIDPRGFDIYSLGAVLYFALEGKHPVSGGLSSFRLNQPMVLQHMVRKAMAPARARYAGAEAMLEDIEHLLRLTDGKRLCDALISELPSASGKPESRKESGPMETGRVTSGASASPRAVWLRLAVWLFAAGAVAAAVAAWWLLH